MPDAHPRRLATHRRRSSDLAGRVPPIVPQILARGGMGRWAAPAYSAEADEPLEEIIESECNTPARIEKEALIYFIACTLIRRMTSRTADDAELSPHAPISI